MKPLRLAVAAAALAAVVLPATANAWIGCTLYWEHQEIAGRQVDVPRCAY